MGEDGAKRVVVNSVGREIRTLDEDPPTEGKRLQLTIDYDVQKAIEDGFKAAGLQRRRGGARSRATATCWRSPACRAYDPNAFAAGIDRATWASLNSDELRAAAGPRDPGALFAGVDVQDGGGAGRRSRKGSSRRTSTRTAPATRTSTAAFKCWKKGGHGSIDLRHAIEQSCNVYFYTVGNMVGIDKINKWATLLGLGVKSGIDLPERGPGPGAVARVEAREDAREVVRRRDDLGRRSARARSSVTPVSMAVYMATLANGGTRVTPHLLKAVDDGTGWKPVPPPPPQSKIDIDPDKLQAIRDGLWMVVNGAGTGGRARIAGYDVSGKTGTAQVISNTGRQRRQGQDRPRTCATTAGSCSSRRATTRRSPASSSSSTGSTAATRRADRAPRPRHVLREEGRAAAAAARRTSTAGRTIRRAPAPAPRSRGGGSESEPCSSDASTTTSTGRWSSPSSRCARSAW